MLKSTHQAALPPPAPPALPAGWTEHTAPTGHKYYYNTDTKKSTYTRPTADPIPLPIPPALNPETVHYPSTVFQHPFPAADFGTDFNHQQQSRTNGSFRGRGNFRGGHGYQDRRRHEREDRPKHKYAIPGCAPWILVKTKLKRRFVYNSDTKESLWKFPENVMKAVVQFDLEEIKKKQQADKSAPAVTNHDDDQAAAEAELMAAAATEEPETEARTVAPPMRPDVAEDSSEYEEVEVTDDEDGDGEGDAKRQKTDEPMEMGEDDIAFQLAAMEEDYGLDPGEYGGDEDMEEGASGLDLTEDDSTALFKDLLEDHHISPYTPWDTIIEQGHIIDDDRYVVLSSMKRRREVWEEWAKEKAQQLKEQKEKQAKRDPRIPYMAFLQSNATPKLYWPEFKRKFRKEPEMKDTKLSDKDREKWYREYINRLKLPQSTLKADLTTLLKSVPLAALNRSTSLEALPPALLADIRYICLSPSIRDPMISTHIASLASAPDPSDLNAEEEAEAAKKRLEREKREQALLERERQVEEQRRKQQREQDWSKHRLKEEQMEIERAMKVGRDGLKSQFSAAEAAATTLEDVETA